jgi:formylmethanofuran dehydrogenase subunit C
MKQIISLRLKEQPQLPLEAEQLSPDKLENLSLEEILSLPLLYGNETVKAGQFLQGEISQAPGEGVTLILTGDFSRVKRLGQGMKSGDLIIEGPAGFHTGAEMSGGVLTIHGDAGDWLGAHMTGGLIRVMGNAGHHPGAAYRGKLQGMKGGAILIHGNAGRLAGAKMRGGLLAILGDCQDNPGYGMNAGTIIIGGTSGRHIGSCMIRGTIILLKNHDLLPTFYKNCIYQPTFWPVIHGYLTDLDFKVTECGPEAAFARYNGEALTGGKGEVLICCHQS